MTALAGQSVSINDVKGRSIGGSENVTIISLDESSERKLSDFFEHGGRWVCSDDVVKTYQIKLETETTRYVDYEGNEIYITNNKDAKDVSIDELSYFVYYNNEFMPNLIHDAAEEHEIRCGVDIFDNGEYWDGYAIFDTTDLGRVYVYSCQENIIYTYENPLDLIGEEIIFW